MTEAMTVQVCEVEICGVVLRRGHIVSHGPGETEPLLVVDILESSYGDETATAVVFFNRLTRALLIEDYDLVRQQFADGDYSVALLAGATD